MSVATNEAQPQTISNPEGATIAWSVALSLVLTWASIASFLLIQAWRKGKRKQEQGDGEMLMDERISLISHEVRQPLHVLSSSLSLLKEDPAFASVVELSLISEACESLHRVVNDLLDYTSLRQQRFSITLAPTDIRPLLRRLAAAHRSLAKVPIAYRVDDSVPSFVMADGLRLAQVLANGLTNSCKFTNEGMISLEAWVETEDEEVAAAGATEGAAAPAKRSWWNALTSAKATVAPQKLGKTVNGPRLVFVVTDTGPGPSKPKDNTYLTGLMINTHNSQKHKDFAVATDNFPRQYHFGSLGRSFKPTLPTLQTAPAEASPAASLPSYNGSDLSRKTSPFAGQGITALASARRAVVAAFARWARSTAGPAAPSSAELSSGSVVSHLQSGPSRQAGDDASIVIAVNNSSMTRRPGIPVAFQTPHHASSLSRRLTAPTPLQLPLNNQSSIGHNSVGESSATIAAAEHSSSATAGRKRLSSGAMSAVAAQAVISGSASSARSFGFSSSRRVESIQATQAAVEAGSSVLGTVREHENEREPTTASRSRTSASRLSMNGGTVTANASADAAQADQVLKGYHHERPLSDTGITKERKVSFAHPRRVSQEQYEQEKAVAVAALLSESMSRQESKGDDGKEGSEEEGKSDEEDDDVVGSLRIRKPNRRSSLTYSGELSSAGAATAQSANGMATAIVHSHQYQGSSMTAPTADTSAAVAATSPSVPITTSPQRQAPSLSALTNHGSKELLQTTVQPPPEPTPATSPQQASVAERAATAPAMTTTATPGVPQGAAPPSLPTLLSRSSTGNSTAVGLQEYTGNRLTTMTSSYARPRRRSSLASASVNNLGSTSAAGTGTMVSSATLLRGSMSARTSATASAFNLLHGGPSSHMASSQSYNSAAAATGQASKQSQPDTSTNTGSAPSSVQRRHFAGGDAESQLRSSSNIRSSHGQAVFGRQRAPSMDDGHQGASSPIRRSRGVFTPKATPLNSHAGILTRGGLGNGTPQPIRSSGSNGSQATDSKGEADAKDSNVQQQSLAASLAARMAAMQMQGQSAPHPPTPASPLKPKALTSAGGIGPSSAATPTPILRLLTPPRTALVSMSLPAGTPGVGGKATATAGGIAATPHPVTPAAAAAAVAAISSSSIRAKVGSGLGLKVAHLLAENLGGYLRLYRDEERQLTVYKLVLPLVLPPPGPTPSGAFMGPSLADQPAGAPAAPLLQLPAAPPAILPRSPKPSGPVDTVRPSDAASATPVEGAATLGKLRPVVPGLRLPQGPCSPVPEDHTSGSSSSTAPTIAVPTTAASSSNSSVEDLGVRYSVSMKRRGAAGALAAAAAASSGVSAVGLTADGKSDETGRMKDEDSDQEGVFSPCPSPLAHYIRTPGSGGSDSGEVRLTPAAGSAGDSVLSVPSSGSQKSKPKRPSKEGDGKQTAVVGSLFVGSTSSRTTNTGNRVATTTPEAEETTPDNETVRSPLFKLRPTFTLLLPLSIHVVPYSPPPTTFSGPSRPATSFNFPSPLPALRQPDTQDARPSVLVSEGPDELGQNKAGGSSEAEGRRKGGGILSRTWTRVRSSWSSGGVAGTPPIADRSPATKPPPSPSPATAASSPALMRNSAKSKKPSLLATGPNAGGALLAPAASASSSRPAVALPDVSAASVDSGVFSHRAPMPATGTVTSSTASEQPGKPPLLPLRVLCVDDQQSNRMLMERMLSRLGNCECLVLHDGLDVIPALQQAGMVRRDLGPIPGAHLLTRTGRPWVPTIDTSTDGGAVQPPRPFDLLFLDIIMDYSDGSEVCAALRKLPDLPPDLPIYAATGNGNSVDALRAAGFTGVLGKPFTLSALREVVETVKANAKK